MSNPAVISTAISDLDAAVITQKPLLEANDFVPQLCHLGALVGVGDAAVVLAANAVVPLPLGARIDLYATAATPFTVDDSDVTVLSAGGLLSVTARYSAASLTQTEIDVWFFAGDLA